MFILSFITKFLIVSALICVIVNVFAYFYEKHVHKKMKKLSKEKEDKSISVLKKSDIL